MGSGGGNESEHVSESVCVGGVGRREGGREEGGKEKLPSVTRLLMQ